MSESFWKYNVLYEIYREKRAYMSVYLLDSASIVVPVLVCFEYFRLKRRYRGFNWNYSQFYEQYNCFKKLYK